MEIISRKDAKEKGLKRYFTGKECKYGHIAQRQTCSGTCLECERLRFKKDYQENPEKYKEINRHAYQKNREAVLEKRKKMRHVYRQRRRENRDKVNKYQMEYRKKNSEHLKAYYREYRKRDYRNTSELKMTNFMRSSIRRTFELMGTEKECLTVEILGYSPIQLKTHIEDLFVEGMSWENYGEWHIDHIKPINNLSPQSKDDVKEVNSLNNLAPMWAEDNLSKGDMELQEWIELLGEDSVQYKRYSRLLSN